MLFISPVYPSKIYCASLLMDVVVLVEFCIFHTFSSINYCLTNLLNSLLIPGRMWTLGYLLQHFPKYYDNVFFCVGLTTLFTYIDF